ncbi:MAG: hypothetical protein ABIX01_11205 [Chitinophagaceae bacterium]
MKSPLQITPLFFSDEKHLLQTASNRLPHRIVFSILSLITVFSVSGQTLVWQESFDSASLSGKRSTCDFGDGSVPQAMVGAIRKWNTIPVVLKT